MAKSIYIIGLEAGSGKSLISIGLMAALREQFNNCTFFKPIANTDHGNDIYIHLMKHYFELQQDEAQLSCYGVQEANELLARQKSDELLRKIFNRYKKLESESDFVICEGTDFTGDNNPVELDVNIDIANNLGCQVLLVLNGAGQSTSHILQDVDLGLSTLAEKRAEVIGLFINRVNLDFEKELSEKLHKRYGKKVASINVIPEVLALSKPTVADVAELMQAEVVVGQDQIHRLVNDYTVAAKHLRSFLSSRRDRSNMMIITPGDREDILVGCLLADQSASYPKISGVILTSGDKPTGVIQEIISGLKNPFPVIATKLNTFETATKLDGATFHTTAEQPEKIKKIISHFARYVNTKDLLEALTNNASQKLTPPMFLYNLVQLARQKKQHIVLPEASDIRILQAAENLLRRNIVAITLLGNPDEVLAQAKAHDLDLSAATIIDPRIASEQHTRYAQQYFDLRQHKGVNLTIAQDRLHEGNYFATMMVYNGDADGMVSGAMHTTGHTIRPALEVIKTKKNVSKVASVFLMCLPDRVLVYGDCAVIPNPGAQTLTEIATQAANTANRFGITPKVAMLSYSSGDSGAGASVDKVREATELLHQQQPDLLVAGPIQYDAAVDPSVAQKKMPDSNVAGHANVLIFPDLDTGNNTYKAVQRETGAIAIGPVLLGLNKPVNDLSRGCTVPDIINTVVITAIQAQNK